MSALLTVAMIMKNEAANLPECLASLRPLEPLLAEIVIYDTGSTDDSIAIAEAAGARVIRGYWDDDFSRARNAALEGVRTKWVMSIDADERLDVDASALHTALTQGLTWNMTGLDGYGCTVFDMDTHEVPVRRYASMKLFRPSRMVWAGALHEQPTRRDGGRPALAGLPEHVFRLRHYGFAVTEALPDKGLRNLEAAERDVQEHVAAGNIDATAKGLLDRGRSHSAAGNTEAAIADLRACRELPAKDVYVRWAGETLAGIYLNENRTAEAAELVRQLKQEQGSEPGGYHDYLMAVVRYQQERYEESLTLLRGLREMTLSTSMTQNAFEAVRLRMYAAIAVKQADEAFACCLQLLSNEPEHPDLVESLLHMWGDQPVEALVTIIRDVLPGKAAPLARALRDQGGIGPAVAAALEGRTPASRGAAFGLSSS